MQQSSFEQFKLFLEAVYTRRRLFIVVAASIALIAVFSCFFRVKVYEAKSSVFIERNVLDSLMKGLTVSPSMDDRIRVLRYSMVSRDLVTRTLKQLEMDVDERYIEPVQFETLVKKCMAKTSIRIQKQEMFTVSIIDPDPDFAQKYINTLVNIYVEENLTDKREESYSANRFLTEQVTIYKQKLDEIDNRIIAFRKETGIYTTSNEPSIMAKISQDEETLNNIKSLKAESYATIKTIGQQLEMSRARALGYSAPSEGNGAGNEIEQLQSKLDDLLLVYNDQYPSVIKLKDQIIELQKRQQDNRKTSRVVVQKDTYNPIDDPIYVDLKMRMNTAQSNLNALEAKEKDLLASIRASKDLLRNFPEDKKTLNDLERERSMQAALYEKLLERVNISEVSKQMEVSDKSTTFRIVDPAILPTTPVGKKRIVLMLIGIFAGLVAGLASVYVAEQADSSIKTPQELRALGVTVLAEIPFIWCDAETKLIRNKDKAALAFAGVCVLMIGILLLHDLLGMSFIDHILANLRVGNNLA